MINNLLKAVGVDYSYKSASGLAPSFDDASTTTASSTRRKHGLERDAAAIVDNNDNNSNSHPAADLGENLASAIGGWFGNLQDHRFRMGGVSTVSAIGGRNYYKSSVGEEGRIVKDSSFGHVNSQQGGYAKSSSMPLSGSQSSSGSTKLINNGVYQGRKVVPNVHHLYEVVDDKEAHLYYDHIFSLGGSTEVTLDDLSDSAIGSDVCMKEEELIDRMLSQFPEFGTNLPTPLTMMDEDDLKNEERVQRCKSSASQDGGQRTRNSVEDGPKEQEGIPSPSQFLADDTPDFIRKFFFGIPFSNSATVTGSVGGDGGSVSGSVKRGFSRSPSFATISSISTVKSTSGSSCNKVEKIGRMAKKEEPINCDGETIFLDATKRDKQHGESFYTEENDNHVHSFGWDQDEIDLWCKPSRTVSHRSLGERTVEELRGHVFPIPTKHTNFEHQDHWTRNRRSTLKRRQKFYNWESLRHDDTLLNTSSDLPQKETKTDNIVICLDAEENVVSPRVDIASHNSGQQIVQIHETIKKNVAGNDVERNSLPKVFPVIVDDGRQHWMPDNLCKQCYCCEAQFTLLRRRHHCRFCGMIFCAACSAFFVEVVSRLSEGNTKKGNKGPYGTMRACEVCYNNLSESGLGVMVHDFEIKSKVENGLVDFDMNPIQMQRKGIASKIRKKKELPMLTPPLRSAASTSEEVNRTSSELAEQFTVLHDRGEPSTEFEALSITMQRLDEERLRREEQDHDDVASKEPRFEEETQDARENIGFKSRLGTVLQRQWKNSSNADVMNVESVEKKKPDINEIELNAAEANVSRAKNFCRQHSQEFFIGSVNDSNTNLDGVILTAEDGEETISHFDQYNSRAMSAKVHLGMIAAEYLEKLCRELFQTDAPYLLHEIKEATAESPGNESELTDRWVNTVMTIATRCCATVEPDVKNGDYLDIRPYCKIKVISGGSVDDYAYVSGVAFYKNVTEKRMTKVINNAKILLLSGGIEYTRQEHRVSLDVLLEQEERYMEIIVTKIFKLKPDVLLVGRSVSRKAQELLLRANIALIQYVKPTLMTRIARQTGATLLSSIDHVMNQFGSSILGCCKRFRLVAFRDNDVWIDREEASMLHTRTETAKSVNVSDHKCVPSLLLKKLPNYERQAVLAARKLGESVLDGNEAIQSGLAKRGVVKTYVLIEGCPKELGCTIILRGASRKALKQVKKVLRFMINAAYNLKLETSYILERCGRLPLSYKIPQTPCCSSSICVDFGQPPSNRKVRPWNGSQKGEVSISDKITPVDHQAILITSVWMTDRTQCCPAEVKGICYYSLQDVSLGQFLRDSCFNLSLKCQNPSCKKSVIDHSLSFIHNDGIINITVERMDNPIPTSSLNRQHNDHNLITNAKQEKFFDDKEIDGPIATWTYCTKCEIVVTPLQFISKQTWQWSFGKFLEVYFYNRDIIMNAPGHHCACQMQTKAILYFGCGNLAARFTYEKITTYSVFCRRHLPFDESFHRTRSLQELESISLTSSSLFLKFDRQIEVISRETRELFGSAMNKPEHLQAVLSELNLISAEVNSASKVLHERISSVTTKYSKGEVGKKNDEALFNFPWYFRRYLFMLSSAWNERLSAAGQTVSSMKKVQYGGSSGRVDSAVVPAIVGDASTEDVIEGMKRIRHLQESYSRNYNVRNMTMSRNLKGDGGLFEGNILPDGRIATLEEAELDDEEFHSDQDNIDFEGYVDADVLASRIRVYNAQSPPSNKRRSHPGHEKTAQRSKTSIAADEIDPFQSSTTVSDQTPLGGSYDLNGLDDSHGKSKAVTAGGAVKSALTRFFNRGGNKEDPYLVDLGIFSTGRPRLQAGINGLVIPVFDDQPSTIIAYSLASVDYDVQFKQFTAASTLPDSKSSKHDSSRKDVERKMLGRNKSHIKHTFRDFDEKGQQLCKFVCTTFWAIQFDAVRQAFMNPNLSATSKDSSSNEFTVNSAASSESSRYDIERSYIRSLATSYAWAASGGKSGASFSRTADDRFVIKCISRTELQMFLDCAPAYFEYLSKAFFHGLPTVLCKIVGVYQIGYHNRVTGKRTMEQVAVMQNIFFRRNMSKIFDLKGSLRGRFTRQGNIDKGKEPSKEREKSSKSMRPQRSKSSDLSLSDSEFSGEDDYDSFTTSSSGSDEGSVKNQQTASQKVSTNDAEKVVKEKSVPTLLDGDFLEFTAGMPLPLTDRAKAVFHMSILNDTLFLSIINVLDYSILVGIDEERMELAVGIIDFMRQYDILKQMERVGKSLPMVVGSEAPTIIQPPLYKARFTNAMERYFMTVPSKWTMI